MIDIGLSKLALIGVIALVVIGPERLPKVARLAGTLFGRARRYMNDIKIEVGREIELEELRKMHTDVQGAISDAENSIAKSVGDVSNEVSDAWHSGAVDDHGMDRQSPSDIATLRIKARNFRKKRLIRVAAIPTWYKHQNGRRTRVISAAARVAKYRPASGKSPGFF